MISVRVAILLSTFLVFCTMDRCYAQKKRTWELDLRPRPTIEQWTYSHILWKNWRHELELTDTQFTSAVKLQDEAQTRRRELRAKFLRENMDLPRPDLTEPELLLEYNEKYAKALHPAFTELYAKLTSKILLDHQIKRIEQLYRWGLIRDGRVTFAEFYEPEFIEFLGIDKHKANELKKLAAEKNEELKEFKATLSKSLAEGWKGYFTKNQLEAIEALSKLDPRAAPDSVDFKPMYELSFFTGYRNYRFQRKYKFQWSREEVAQINKWRYEASSEYNKKLNEYRDKHGKNMPTVESIEMTAEMIEKDYSKRLYDLLEPEKYTRLRQAQMHERFVEGGLFNSVRRPKIDSITFLREFKIGKQQYKRIEEGIAKSKREYKVQVVKWMTAGYRELEKQLTREQKKKYDKYFGSPPFPFVPKK